MYLIKRYGMSSNLLYNDCLLSKVNFEFAIMCVLRSKTLLTLISKLKIDYLVNITILFKNILDDKYSYL